ncbi:MAG: hypothetical protein EZS28_036636 [Streblomastix strix]|uniref:Uncharacterized protein n=1 Tax=Streblomastix strix TaxID=222440 RepID=A0A5J4UB99_9EUKA|nr:MAG: hypothetical protein EZS28_036636 [Streblomastix strix]
MLAWKIATDDSFMRGYNSSKIGARTNIQVSLTGTITQGIVDNELIRVNAEENQNNLISFIATRSFPTPTFIFDDAPDPQVLNFEINGEVGGTMIRSG